MQDLLSESNKISLDEASQPSDQHEPKKRKDRGRLHSARNSLLCRGLLETLQRNGQNIKPLRAMEKALRDTLLPTGPLAELFFDKFWASVLRLILTAQLESLAMRSEADVSRASRLPQLYRRSEPMLSEFESDATNQGAGNSGAEILHRLSLISRYDRAASREMYRTLSLLLILRDQGNVALTDWAMGAAGIKGRDD
jgi:hypothetical protein